MIMHSDQNYAPALFAVRQLMSAALLLHPYMAAIISELLLNAGSATNKLIDVKE